MKKYVKYILIFIFICLVIGIIVYINISKLFYKLYDVDKNHVFEKISAKSAVNLIKNETGIIYLGYPDCPWCQDLVPLVNEIAKENLVEKVYYIDDFYYMRPDKNDKPKKQNEYNELVKLLGSEIVELKSSGNEYDIIRVPIVLFVKNGKIVDYHKGTYDGHEIKTKKDETGKTIYYLEDLTYTQKETIKNTLEEKIKKVYSNKCDSGC